MSAFSWALAGFVLLHIGVAATGLRGALVRSLGERLYRILFGIASLVLIVWLGFGYGDMRADPLNALNALLWTPPDWARHITHTLVLLGFLLAVAGLFAANPTMVGFESALQKEEPARGMLRITRHPFMWGVALWSLGHLAINGERFAVMLFGALGLMALYGTRSIDRKARARDQEAWARFAAVTSNIPFAAIIQGRNKLVLSEIWWRLLIALAVFVAVALLHGRLFGAPAFAISL